MTGRQPAQRWHRILQRAVVLAGLASSVSMVEAGELRVAVAANFIAPARELVAAFEASTGHDVVLSSASTGKLYAQITQGAPFDVLLAADSMTPERLEEQGYAVAGTRFTYAVGELVLWSNGARLTTNNGEAILRGGDFAHLALANPRIAPYGAAAMEVVRRLGLGERLKDKLVYAEDVGQAFQFAATGNAALAFVARSQTLSGEPARGGSAWPVPAGWYTPIVQQAVMLRDAQAGVAARDFLAYLRGTEAAALVRHFGYGRAEYARGTPNTPSPPGTLLP